MYYRLTSTNDGVPENDTSILWGLWSIRIVEPTNSMVNRYTCTCIYLL